MDRVFKFQFHPENHQSDGWTAYHKNRSDSSPWQSSMNRIKAHSDVYDGNELVYYRQYLGKTPRFLGIHFVICFEFRLDALHRGFPISVIITFINQSSLHILPVLFVQKFKSFGPQIVSFGIWFEWGLDLRNNSRDLWEGDRRILGSIFGWK